MDYDILNQRHVNYLKQIKDKKIFIAGGSGSLGATLFEYFNKDNHIYNYSRDENKHWMMDMKYQSKKLSHIIGDVRDKDKIKQSLLRVKPDYLIIAAALKHIDRCEYDVNECINTNILGIKNILDSIESLINELKNLECVCFISTDKACSPINIYGMSKAICEQMICEKSLYIKNVKFISVRYGNVLNSRGSIIPMLEEKGRDDKVKSFTLTDERMTRFIMTLDESVKLIEYAILYGDTGEIIIPKLSSMKIKDLLELYKEKYNKPIVVTGLRVGEKLDESLINSSQKIKTIDKGKYYHIQPSYNVKLLNKDMDDYNSGQCLITKEELEEKLIKLGFLNKL